MSTLFTGFKGFKELNELTAHTNTRFEQTNNYINATANLIYSHIAKTEEVIRKDMNAKDLELTTGLETTNTNLADLSANDLPQEVRNMFAKYLRTEDKEIIDSFINLSLAYSNGRYTDFIRAYMYFELMRQHMWLDLEKLYD